MQIVLPDLSYPSLDLVPRGVKFAAHDMALLLLSRMLLLLLLLEVTSMRKPHPGSMARESCVTLRSHASPKPAAPGRIQPAGKRHQIAVRKGIHLGVLIEIAVRVGRHWWASMAGRVLGVGGLELLLVVG